jgi:catechol 2,3-dioxygenase-like lactoylglutathione lyase family enzyme
MKQKIAHIALLVREYDEAIQFFTEKLHFELVEDRRLSATKRWVLVKPPGAQECCLLLARAATPEQQGWIGNQSGGRVFLFLHTDDFERDFQNLLQQKIPIVRSPVQEEYGWVAVFEDLYGNRWDLIGK